MLSEHVMALHGAARRADANEGTPLPATTRPPLPRDLASSGPLLERLILQPGEVEAGALEDSWV